MKTGDKKSTCSWLSTDEAPYESDEFATVLAGKLKDFTSVNLGPGAAIHYNNVALAYTHLYGFDVEGVGANANQVTRSGNLGAIAELRIPAAAAQLRKVWNIVVGPEITWSADATTTDSASEGQAITARNSLHYFWTHEGVGAKAKEVAWDAMGMAEGAMHVPWDLSLGKPIGVEKTPEGKNKLVTSGMFDYRPVSTWDIIRDPTAKSPEALNWVIVREWPDKFDTAASCKTPEQAEACLSSSYTAAPSAIWHPFRATYQQTTDRIPVYYLYAKRSPAVPAGREAVFLEDGTLLKDGPLSEAYAEPEGQLPVAYIAAGNYKGSPWPYCPFFGVLGCAQASDALYKDLLTNATAVSGSVISVEDDNVDGGAAVTTLSGGPQLVTRPKGTQPPVVLQLQQSHPEHFNLIGKLRGESQQILALDNITAGEEIGANLSGVAMALMTSTTVQNNSQMQARWTNFVQDIGNITLRHIQKHLKEPIRIALAGNARSSLVSTAEVSGDSVSGIQRVFATIGSPMQQTDAGKYEIATTALKEQWAKTPEQFQTVMDTGRLDALTQDLSNELILINSENEALGKGEEVPVMLDDDHALHLKVHKAVTSSLTARRDPKVIEATQAHQDHHIRILRETDPAILQLLGQQPAAPPQPQGGPPPAEPEGAQPKPPQELQQENAPGMPTNPVTKEKAGPVAGTIPPDLAIKQASA